MGFGFLHQLFDVGIGEAGRSGDLDGLLLARAEILGGHVHDAVGVDVEGHFNLRHAARCRRNAGQVETGQRHVVGGHRTFALQHVDGHGGLVVRGGRKGLALAGRDGRIAVDQLGEHAAHGFDAEGKRGHVEEQHVLHVAGEDTALNGGAHGDHFIGVHGTVGFLAEEVGHSLLDQRHTGHAADQQHFINVGRLQTGVGQRLAAGFQRLLHEVGHQLFQLGAGQLDEHVLGPGLVSRDEGQVDFGFHRRGQFLFGGFCGVFQTLKSHAVLGKVDALFLLEFFHQIVDDALVEVFAAEEGVAVGGAHFNHVVAHFEDGHVERAAAEVEHDDLFVGLFVKTVGKGSRGGFVDDTLDVESGDLSGVLGGLTLGVVEVGRDGDDRFGHGFAEIGFSVGFQLAEDSRGDFLRGVLVPVDFNHGGTVGASHDFVGSMLLPMFDFGRIGHAPHQTLDRKNGTAGVRHGLTLGGVTDQTLLISEGDHGRGRTAAVRVGDAFGVLAFHHIDTTVRRAEVNANDFAHNTFLLEDSHPIKR